MLITNETSAAAKNARTNDRLLAAVGGARPQVRRCERGWR